MLPTNPLLAEFLSGNSDTGGGGTGSSRETQQQLSSASTVGAMGFSSVVPKKKKIPASQAAQELANMTIDESHGKIMKKFHDVTTKELPLLQTELKEQQKLLKNLLRIQSNNHYGNTSGGGSENGSSVMDPAALHVLLEQRSDCEARIDSLRRQIRHHKDEKQQYLLKNSKYLFKYFEDKKEISLASSTVPETTKHSSNSNSSRSTEASTTTFASPDNTTVSCDNNNNNNAKVNLFFRIPTTRDPPGLTADPTTSTSTSMTNHRSTTTADSQGGRGGEGEGRGGEGGTLSTAMRYNPYSERYSHSRQMYGNYWKNVNQDLTNLQDYFIPSDVCEKCCVGELIAQDDEGVLICNNRQCGHFTSYIIDNEKPSYKEPPNEVTYNPYIRLNHFREILSQFLAKQTTKIPVDVVEAIRKRIKKQRITDLSEINYQQMRQILKQLGLNKYFEHIQYINSIFGIHPPVMSEELQEILCILFIEIQEPWTMHCPLDRTNFFHCTYILYQLCVLLEQRQYLPYIPMMKDREIQLEQDAVWEKVCGTLDWEFIPTV